MSPIQRLSSTVADFSVPAYIAVVMMVESRPQQDADGWPRIALIRSRLERRLSRLLEQKRRAYFPEVLQGRPVWVDDAGFASPHRQPQFTPRANFGDQPV